MRVVDDPLGTDTSGKTEEVRHQFLSAMDKRVPGILTRVRSEGGLPDYDVERVLEKSDNHDAYWAAELEGKQFSTLQSIYDSVYKDCHPGGDPEWIKDVGFSLMSEVDFRHTIHRVVELAFDQAGKDRKNAEKDRQNAAASVINSESRTQPMVQ